MNKDLIIGVVVSLSVHSGVLLLFNSKPKVVVEKVAPPKIEVIEMPEIEPPEPPEKQPGDETDEKPPEFAPPMLQDVPSLVTVSSFTQILQPPPPPNVQTNTGVMTVPINRAVAGNRMADLFDIRDLDQIPQPTYQPQPKYPYDLKRQGIEGYVVLGFIVDSSGNVRDPYVISSSQTDFEGPSLDAVRRWRFRPGRKSGRAVNTRVKQTMPFTIAGN